MDTKKALNNSTYDVAVAELQGKRNFIGNFLYYDIPHLLTREGIIEQLNDYEKEYNEDMNKLKMEYTKRQTWWYKLINWHKLHV